MSGALLGRAGRLSAPPTPRVNGGAGATLKRTINGRDGGRGEADKTRLGSDGCSRGLTTPRGHMAALCIQSEPGTGGWSP
ncbi:hypothetical protein NDU88_000718 [Pleurodeles waltl]|uniref:Uncharacterized protein n=1 Tax=Pleurodeles waltl TaxID=8319 RepID=A0AAV7VY57_PLEWA|nr:hypothetical protein NDU88_000718 [Pleurodeles waltl]